MGHTNIMTSIKHILALSLISLFTSCKGFPFLDELFGSKKPALKSGSGEPKTFTRKVFDNGNIYVGNFLDGEAYGQGIWKTNYGAIYVGEFKHDKSGGHGTYISEDGEVYVGNSEGNMSQGKGVWADGEDFYIGNFQNNEMHGHGKYTWADGSEYVGNFENGKKQDKGEFTYPHGRIQKGYW